MTGFLKKFHHERWPAPLFYAPVAAYYLFTSMRLRKFNYFTAVNPAMKAGGLCGFSKFDSFKNVPKEYLPETFFIKAGFDVSHYKNLTYPRVLKPDQGERGLLVSKVDSFSEVEQILSEHPDIDFLLQDFINYPLELGVFLIREKGKWQLSSITAKKFLSLTGDGFSSLEQLAKKDDRAKDFLHKIADPSKVLPKGETLLVEPIGNHCRGTEFVNACDHISPNLINAFSSFLSSLDGINYCRIDLKTESWEDLENSKFKIMEINGVSAEPGHIYDPKMSLKQAYKDLFSHWRSMTRIAEDHLAEGETFKETFTIVKSHMSKKKKIRKHRPAAGSNGLSKRTRKRIKNRMGNDLDFSLIANELKMESNPVKSLESLLSQIDVGSLKSFSPEGYNRVVLHSDDACELVLCCWGPNQKTEKHHHNGRKCWFRCVEGSLSEKRENKEMVSYTEGEWGSIDDSMGAHEMYNLTDSNIISFHFYSEV